MGHRSAIARSLFLAATVVLGSCKTPGAADVTVATGTWGGTQASVTVTAKGAHVEFACASGDMSQPMMVDSRGEFSLDGVYVHEVGPARVQEAARYTGRVENQTMSLTVTVTSSSQTIGPFTLAYGTQPSFAKCM